MRRIVLLIIVLALIGYLYFLFPFNVLTQPIIFQLRFFRLLLAIYAGISLSVFGLFLQGMLDNPLVEPYTLGIASGAALGVGIGCLLNSPLGTNILAFAGAALATFFVFFLARVSRRRLKEGLILAGIIIGFFASGVVFLLLTIGGRKLHEIIYLLMGYLGKVPTHTGYWQLLISSLFSLLAILYIYFNTKALDIIATGYESARTLGIDIERFLTTGFLLISLAVGLLVAQVGVVGFVGLVVPHLARMVVGDKHRPAFYASIFLGTGFILISDLIARSITNFELPIGVVTSIIGGPFFVYLLVRR